MNIKEVEQLISCCHEDVAEVSQKAEVFTLVEYIVGLRKFSGRAYVVKENTAKEQFLGTLEDKLAIISIHLLSLANAYNMDLHSLTLDKKLCKFFNYEDLIKGMLKVAMSQYNIQKKIIVLLGMIFCYCLRFNIDVVHYIKKRLEIGDTYGRNVCYGTC